MDGFELRTKVNKGNSNPKFACRNRFCTASGSSDAEAHHKDCKL